MMDDQVRQRLAENWRAVEAGVAESAEVCGRRPSEITIVGVTKYVDADHTRALVDAGCTHLGESRPQSLWQKAESSCLQVDVTWHLIGHLQTNKVRRLLRHRPIVHSVDSQRLLQAIADESAARDRTTRILLEINISGDEAKTGLSPREAEALLELLPQSGIELMGLMAMAGWGTERDEARRQFEATRELRDQWSQRYQLDLPELSMGMSGDFREAIAAGSTIVRIGSRLFEGIELGDES
jgi:pyridoxal phosphate enzyme (YggS family)